MVRTQIQLTREQAEALRLLASRLKVSQAELVRRGIDQLTRNQAGLLSPDRLSKALAAVGKYASGYRDVSDRHDKHLAEVLGR